MFRIRHKFLRPPSVSGRRFSSLSASLTYWMVALGLVWVLLIYLAAPKLVDFYVRELEEVELRKDRGILEEALAAERDNVLHKALDWGRWSEAYAFLRDGNRQFIDQNLDANSLKNFDVSGIAYVRFDNKYIASNYIDLDGVNNFYHEKSEWKTFSSSEYIKNNINKDNFTGYTLIGGELVSFSAVPVYKSDASGSPNGYVIIGRLVDIEIIQKVLKLKISYVTYKNYYSNYIDYSGKNIKYIFMIPKYKVNNNNLYILLEKNNENLGSFVEITEKFLVLITAVIFSFFAIFYIFIKKIITGRVLSLYKHMSFQKDKYWKEDILLGDRYDEITALQIAYNDLIKRINDKIHQEEMYNRMLSRALVRAEDARKAKAKFIANVSHEIRTPLAAITSSIHLIVRRHGDLLDKALVRSLTASASMLKLVVDDVLDFSKFEKEGVPLKLDAFDMVEISQSIVELNAASATDKGLELRSHYLVDSPTMVIGDKLRLSQILGNLISNAIKFTHAGSVELAISRVAGRDGDCPRWRFEVRDTGVGIPDGLQRKLFEPFVQITSGQVKQPGGTGLGLSICKKIVEAMGGNIGYDDLAGGGTCFWFEIDMPIAPDKALMAPTAHHADAAQGLRVLLAEDNHVLRGLMVNMLEILGHHVVAVENGQSAVDVISSGGFDLVMLDIHMPVLGGVEAVTRLRAMNAPLRHLPVIALTADAYVESDIGFDLVLIKPVGLDELAQAMQRAMSRAAHQPAYLM